jgi:methylated-DNA-[protein]-cysteine S-methyltransferase
MTELMYATLASPIGELRIVSTADGVCAIAFDDRWQIAIEQLGRRFGRQLDLVEGDPHSAVENLERYFAGTMTALDGLAVDPGGTEFQRRVWDALRRIPVGATVSYGRLARDIGRESAVRAVGAANGQNPVAVAVPCHRVIGSNGKLTGYAGGLDRKHWLLEHERGQMSVVRSQESVVSSVVRATASIEGRASDTALTTDY